jgi:putative ABC transport system ATP-binding protein
MTAPILETRDVCKHFKSGAKGEVRAVHEISLAIQTGSSVALTGPSGSGKSTLLALLGALDRPTRGAVHFEGRDLAAYSDVELARTRRRMGFVFQNFSLIRGLPAWENITYPLIPRGTGRARRAELAAELLGSLNLTDKYHARPEELSGGEQQRIAVARALAGQPAVLLADEPTSNLDEAAGAALAETFQAIHSRGTTVILATHDPRLLALADTVHDLNAGRLRK